MAIELGVFRGVIRGKIIELEEDPGLREGDPVEVRLKLNLPPGEGLRRAAGGWDEEGLTLEQLLEEMRRIRKGTWCLTGIAR
jgi:hypothetical protein